MQHVRVKPDTWVLSGELHATMLEKVHLLGYPRSHIDGSNLYEIPHFVVWPI